MTKILQKDAKELRMVAKEVPLQDIGSAKIQRVIKHMKEALEGEEDGVAIAAPQIGESVRIFIVSHRAFEMLHEAKSEAPVDEEGEKKVFNDEVFINPKLTKVSKEKVLVDEGCLSVRYLYGKVLRAKKATVEAYDEQGRKFTSGASGIIAQIFQHETDHLDGVLFVDEATDLEEISPEHLKGHKKDE